LFELTVGNRLHLLKKKILLNQGKNQEGDKEIPDAEMGLGRQSILFLGIIGAEERTKFGFQIFHELVSH
jgi:hypothetical protein